ncbi:acetamidase [Moniliophthora roreri]|nr:acetamidase [Moniliophthora roreri]
MEPNQSLKAARTNAVFVISSPRVIGGCGPIFPSSHSIAKQSFLPPPCSTSWYSFSLHRFRTARGSFSQGCASTTAFMNTFNPPIEFEIGPRTDRTESCPSREFTQPPYGTRPYDGRKP